MRKLANIFKRKAFEDIDKFSYPTTVLQEETDLTKVADKQLVVNDSNELLLRRGNKLVSVSSKQGVGAIGKDGKPGAAGANGANAYVYIAYASDASGTDFTMTFNSALDYIAILSTDTEIASPIASDFTGLWKKYKGEVGTDGVGVPSGGTTGQVLKKIDGTDYNTEWSDEAGGLTDAPSDGKTYGRENGNWVEIISGTSSYEYLPDYIEVDSSNILIVHPERVIWNNATNQTYYLYKDFGVNYFDANFEIQFTFYWISTTANSSVNYMLMLTRDINTYANLVSGSKDFLSVFFNKTVGGTITLGIREVNGGSATTSTDTSLTTNTFYFATLDRDESVGTYGQLRLRIYSDYTRTTLVATLTLALTEKQDFQYMELAVTGGAASASYGLIEDIKVVTA